MIGVIYYIAYLLCAIVISAVIFNDYKRHQILIIGLGIGTLIAAWIPAGISLIFSKFNILTNVIALAFILLVTILTLIFNKERLSIFKKTWDNYDLRDEVSMLLTILPFMILIFWLFSGHILLTKDGALYGGQSTYGDLSMHMGMITSIARQGIFPPEYSILPGARLSYPFLVNSLSSSLYLLNTTLRTAIILPSMVMSFVCFAGFYILAKKISGKNISAMVAVLLFFVTGGIGIIYFLGDADMLKNIFTGFYQTPVNLPKLNLRWVNVICDMMVPQRTSLMGWSVLIVAMFLLYDGMKRKLSKNNKQGSYFIDNKELIAAGTITGLMPMVHTHSFLALGILCTGILI